MHNRQHDTSTPHGNNHPDDDDVAEDVSYYRETQTQKSSISPWKMGSSIVTIVAGIAISAYVLQTVEHNAREGNPPNLFGMQDTPFHYTENPFGAQMSAAVRRYMQGRCTTEALGVKTDDTHVRVDCLVGNENHVFILEAYEAQQRWYIRHRVEY